MYDVICHYDFRIIDAKKITYLKTQVWKSYPTNALKQKWGRKGFCFTFAPPNYYLFINASG